LEELKASLAASFPMKMLGYPSTFTGISVKKLPGGALKLHQGPYINRVIDLMGFGGASVSNTPTVAFRLTDEPATEEERGNMIDVPFRQQQGVALWCGLTCRADLCFAVHQTGRRSADPRPTDWSGLKKIFKYLKGTPEMGLIFRKIDPTQHAGLVIYSDSDWAGHSTRRSTYCFIMFYNGTPIFWRTGLFRSIALSTMEAELMAVSEAAKLSYACDTCDSRI
jgi:hypothetical protein